MKVSSVISCALLLLTAVAPSLLPVVVVANENKEEGNRTRHLMGKGSVSCKMGRGKMKGKKCPPMMRMMMMMTRKKTMKPTKKPTKAPTMKKTMEPTKKPTKAPTSKQPTAAPTAPGTCPVVLNCTDLASHVTANCTARAPLNCPGADPYCAVDVNGSPFCWYGSGCESCFTNDDCVSLNPNARCVRTINCGCADPGVFVNVCEFPC